MSSAAGRVLANEVNMTLQFGKARKKAPNAIEIAGAAIAAPSHNIHITNQNGDTHHTSDTTDTASGAASHMAKAARVRQVQRNAPRANDVKVAGAATPRNRPVSRNSLLYIPPSPVTLGRDGQGSSRLLTKKQVADLIGFSTKWIERHEIAGTFPRGIRFPSATQQSTNSRQPVRWLESDVLNWIAERRRQSLDNEDGSQTGGN